MVTVNKIVSKWCYLSTSKISFDSPVFCIESFIVSSGSELDILDIIGFRLVYYNISLKCAVKIYKAQRECTVFEKL